MKRAERAAGALAGRNARTAELREELASSASTRGVSAGMKARQAALRSREQSREARTASANAAAEARRSASAGDGTAGSVDAAPAADGGGAFGDGANVAVTVTAGDWTAAADAVTSGGDAASAAVARAASPKRSSRAGSRAGSAVRFADQDPAALAREQEKKVQILLQCYRPSTKTAAAAAERAAHDAEQRALLEAARRKNRQLQKEANGEADMVDSDEESEDEFLDLADKLGFKTQKIRNFGGIGKVGGSDRKGAARSRRGGARAAPASLPASH